MTIVWALFSRPAETEIVDETQTGTERTGIADIRYRKRDAELKDMLQISGSRNGGKSYVDTNKTQIEHQPEEEK